MRFLPPLSAILLLAGCGGPPPSGPAPHQIHIVGSWAAYPLSTAVAERFMREETDAIAPLVQADGNADGFARFCGGVGPRYPDVAGATRPMTDVEQAVCAHNKVGPITAIPIGETAIVLVARKDTPALALTRAALTRALTSTASTWAEIDPRLPAVPIMIHGPGPAAADALLPTAGLRTDGAYRSHGADAGLVASEVEKRGDAIGIMPYPDALEQRDSLRLLPLDRIIPAPASIAAGLYPAHVPLTLYVKARETPSVPGLPKLLALYADAFGPAGALPVRGFVPLSGAARDAARARIAALSHP